MVLANRRSFLAPTGSSNPSDFMKKPANQMVRGLPMGDTGLELEQYSPEKLAEFIRGAAESGAVQIIDDSSLFQLANSWNNMPLKQQ